MSPEFDSCRHKSDILHHIIPIKLKPNVIKYEAIPENKPIKNITEIIIATKFIIQINKYTFIEKNIDKNKSIYLLN